MESIDNTTFEGMGGASLQSVSLPSQDSSDGVANDQQGPSSISSPQPSDPDSPTSFVSHAPDSSDLLRRLTIASTQQSKPQTMRPSEVFPHLELSNNLLSVAICLPKTFGIGEDGWKTEPRRGSSSLFDAFSYLSSEESTWNHTLIGWTGEIKSESSARKDQERSPDKSKPHTSPHNFIGPVDPAVNLTQKPVSLPSDAVQLTGNDRNNLEKTLLNDPAGKMVPVWLFDRTEERNGDLALADQARWRRYAEHDLYTLFHYKQNDASDVYLERKRWMDYVRLNRKFADKVAGLCQAGDIVWIHDYHLMLLPIFLRYRLPNIYIGFMLHAPFPTSELFRCLGKRKEILRGVLGANMIGFQTYSHSRHFASCCSRILGCEVQPGGVDDNGAHIATDVFPVGIDAAGVARSAYAEPGVGHSIGRIRKQFAGQKIVVGRDRLDTIRGIAQKLHAFQKFLDKYPEWQGNVVLIQITSPTSIKEEKEDLGNKTASKVSALVSNINTTYGGLEYNPVHHYAQYLSKDEYFALLRVADLALITSVRDGMNTTSLEFIVCQKEKKSPLILSEFSGTAASLHQAIHINPWDFEGVADSIHQALTMPAIEKTVAYKQMYQHVTTHTIHQWAQDYLSRLAINLASFKPFKHTPILDRASLLNHYLHARRRLFMFDYDGTLTPIVKDPQAALPSDHMINAIKILAKEKRNNVWIISGRDQAFLDEWLGHIPELGLSAEHGSFIRQPEQHVWQNLTEDLDMSWQHDVMNVFQHFTERTQGSCVERKRIALTWHYRGSDPENGASQAAECHKRLEATVAKTYDVEVMRGKANLEVRPRFVNKGEIAKRLVAEYGEVERSRPDFVFCTGDDFTDEDMFRALKETDLPAGSVFSVTVGESTKKTLADWHLREPSDVIDTVALLDGSITLADLDTKRETTLLSG